MNTVLYNGRPRTRLYKSGLILAGVLSALPGVWAVAAWLITLFTGDRLMVVEIWHSPQVPSPGEETAQACDNACLRQVSIHQRRTNGGSETHQSRTANRPEGHGVTSPQRDFA